MQEDAKTTNFALLRMRKAHEAGRGVRLSHGELHAFSVEILGQWWSGVNEDGSSVNDDDHVDLWSGEKDD